MLAERRAAAENGQVIQLAPRMRSVSVSLEISEDRIKSWKTGTALTFKDAHQVNRISYINERKTSHYYDIIAQFVSAVPKTDTEFEITVIVQPNMTLALLKADAEDRLSVIAEGEEDTRQVEREKRCYVTRRVGDERQRVEIPCT